ncbi:hypothetical protein FRX31_012925, partial [Thalictrum thalictroides]
MPRVDKQHKYQPCASQIGNKTATQKDQPHQSIRFTTILDEKLPGRSVRTNYGRVMQRSFLIEPTNVPSNQKAKTLMTYASTSASPMSTSASSVSTSASSYSSSAAQETSFSESEESIPSRLMTHQRVASSSFLSPNKHDNKARIYHEGSMEGSRRMPTLDPPQHAGSMANMEKTENRIGRIRRLKNKLGVIFHHHHHHHHHHHNGNETEVGHTTLSNNHKSVGNKYFQKMLHRKRKEGKAKSRLHSTDYGLIDGLIRHIWHTKKSKKSSDMKGLGKIRNNKMKVKKWYWWQNVSK